MIDPGHRWTDEKPEYCGLPSYGGLPYTESVEDLADADAAIVGAPFDELSPEGSQARFGPRAIRAASLPMGASVEDGVNLQDWLRVIDFGDAPVIPTQVDASHRAIHDLVRQVVDSGVIPIVLGGDHSITEPEAQACAEHHGSLGMLHFDAHADTAESFAGSSRDNGTMMRTLVEDGHVDGSRYAQVGLRGYWPEPEVFEWQQAQGIAHYTVRDIERRSLSVVVEEAVKHVGPGPCLITVDVDVLEQAFVPGVAMPEPGGLLPRELLSSCEWAAENLEVVCADVVEVSPVAFGTKDGTAVAGDRVTRALLQGIAKRRSRSA